ncbi:MAG: glycoside hydrolase, partial [Nitrospinota bacterium]
MKQANISKFLTIHGHFYQPPRANPWLNIIETQDSATPFHDWNERINRECYAPNSVARILDEAGLIKKIVNNFELISFNIGPTLLAWIEENDAKTYRRILEADKKSIDRFSGHGNAIAQCYNHQIMPLATVDDQITQIEWGIADFESRFQR